MWKKTPFQRLDLLIFCAFGLLPLLLYGNVTLGGQTMLPVDNLFQWQPYHTYSQQFELGVPQNSLLSDMILQNYVWKKFALSSWQNGELPLWSPQIFGGAPFLANGQHSLYYPFSLLFLLLPIANAYGWFTLSQLWLAGVFGYLFGRSLHLRRDSSALLGLIYQGCGFLVVSAAVFPMILASAVWLPLLLACIEKIIQQSQKAGGSTTLPYATLGALALGCLSFAGHPEMLLYSLLICALYGAWRWISLYDKNQPIGRWLKPLLWLWIMVSVGLLLGAIQLLPAFELAGTNFRAGSASFADVRSWGFPLRRSITFALPNFFGNPSHTRYFDLFTRQWIPFTTNYYGEQNPSGFFTSAWELKNYVEGGIYLGILPLILVGCAVRVPKPRRGLLLFFALLAFFSLNFIFGSPLYALLYYGLPFINQLHSPFRWAYALSLCVAVLAALGWETRPQWRGIGRWILPLSGLALLVATTLSLLFFSSLRPLVHTALLRLALAAYAFPSAEAFFSYIFPQALFFGLLLFANGLILQLRHPRWRVILAFALLVVDFWAINRGFHAANPPELLDFRPKLVTWLEQQEGTWRLTTFEAHGDKPFHANLGWLHGFHDIRGYDSIINRQYVDYMNAIEPQNELPYNRIAPLHNWQSLNSPLLDLLNVRFIITSETLDLPKLQLAWEGDGLRVYENKGVMPRAYTLPATAAQQSAEPLLTAQTIDPRTTLLLEQLPPTRTDQPAQPASHQAATITSYGNVEVWVDARVAQPSFLVLGDSFAQGWKAFVRPHGTEDSAEQESPIYRANGNFRAIYLPDEGNYTVRFRYSPRSFILGGLATFMATALIALGGSVWAWRRWYRQEGELTNTQSIAKNSLVPMALNLFNKGIDFAFAAFYLRILGPGQAGSYATAISLALWFDIVANWGLDALIIRDVAQDRQKARHYLLNTSLLRLFTMLIGIIPVVVFTLFIGQRATDPALFWALGLIVVGMLFSGLGKGITGVFYVYESAEYPALLSTITTILKVLFGVAALLLGTGFVGLAAVSILTNIITLALLWTLATRLFPLSGQWQIDWALQRHAFTIGYPLMLNHLLATIFFKIDQPLLYRYEGAVAVGWYNSAYKWVDAFNIIPSFFTFALFPIISRQVTSNLADAQRTFRMAVKLLILVALPLATIVTALANPMIGSLGGAEFLPHGAIALRLVIWSLPIGWINSVTNYVIVALGLEQKLTWGFVVGVLFNTIGNILFIPRYGYVAAAITTILSELILLVMFNYYLRQKMSAVGWLQLLVRPILLTAVMGLAIWLGSYLHPLFGGVLGVAIYLGGLWFLGIIGHEEQQIIGRLLPKK